MQFGEFKELINNKHFGIIVSKGTKVLYKNAKSKEILQHDIKTFEHYNELKDLGNNFDIDLQLKSNVVSLNIFRVDSDKFTTWVLIDIDKRIAFREELIFQKHLAEYNANYDILTELPNRNLFMSTVQEKIQNKTEFSLVHININSFRLINDEYGNTVGDTVLQEFSKRLKHIYPDKFISRYSGDEFIIITNNAGDIARNITTLNKTSLCIEDFDEINVSTSIGISHYPKDAKTIESLLINTNLALLDANTGSWLCYNTAMKIKNINKLTMKNDILQGIERDEFILHYQPQIDSRTEELVGLEALVRWDHPTKGLLYPDKFINEAERLKLLIKLDRHLLRKIANQSIKLKEKYNYKYSISANISAGQLEKKLEKYIKSVLCENHCNDCPKELCSPKVYDKLIKLEITETELMQKLDITLHELNKIRNLGIEISIDDFGTGYSSLAYLTMLPISTLKIDKTFIDTINGDERVLKTIIALAKTLDLGTICEGVETLEQVNTLKKYGCYIIQGYYYSKPLPIGDIIEKYFSNSNS